MVLKYGVSVHLRALFYRNQLHFIITQIVGSAGFQEREVVVETAVSQEELGLTGDDYDDSSKAAFEKFVADIKVSSIARNTRESCSDSNRMCLGAYRWLHRLPLCCF